MTKYNRLLSDNDILESEFEILQIQYSNLQTSFTKFVTENEIVRTIEPYDYLVFRMEQEIIMLKMRAPLLWLACAVTVLAAIIASLVMVEVSHRNFKGVTGDVLGATNELTGMVSLIILLVVIGWV
jgi:cobalamin synthase